MHIWISTYTTCRSSIWHTVWQSSQIPFLNTCQSGLVPLTLICTANVVVVSTTFAKVRFVSAQIVRDATPGNHLFELLPSSKRLRGIKTRTTWFKNSMNKIHYFTPRNLLRLIDICPKV